MILYDSRKSKSGQYTAVTYQGLVLCKSRTNPNGRINNESTTKVETAPQLYAYKYYLQGTYWGQDFQ